MPIGNKNLTICKLWRSLLKVLFLNTLTTLQFYHGPAKESKHQFLYRSDQLLL